MVLIKQFIKKLLYKVGLIKSKQIWKTPTEEQLDFYKKNIQIIAPKSTLNHIQNQIEKQIKGAYLRFGDGDIYLMLGKNEMLNVAHKKLAKEMKEVMALNIGKNQKGLPLHSEIFGYEDYMAIGMHLVSDFDAIKYLHACYPYFKQLTIYSPVALHYVATYDVHYCVSFLQFLKNTNPIFVGNENIKPALVTKLFGDVHIKTPAQNSYSAIDVIEKQLLKALNYDKKTFKVIVVAMGCPGRVLQKRILKKGYNVYLFDFGSLLDAFNNDDTREWITLSGGTSKLQEMLHQIN